MNIEKRNIGTCIILSIVTCGIYAIIWAIKMLKEAVQVKDQNDDGTVEIILGILLCPVGFFMAEKKLSEGCAARGIAHEDRSILYLVLGLIGLGIVDYAMMQSDLNKLADMYAGAPAPDVRYQAPQYQAPQYQPPQYQPPQAPQYQPPQYQPPQAPQYEAPAAPQYEAPEAPEVEVPEAPAFEAPEVPEVEIPEAPAFETPADIPPTDPTI
ncbi:MAG: DUF4234 domain-containing protein [Clostridia bacterium]|nr:DUF4234 domain-containing protein [Clostridia bacterium]